MANEAGLVSVIVPAYNNEQTIERCIRSVLAQSWPLLEILAVDDGSSDRTGFLLDQLAREDARVHPIHQANEGVSHARDRGVEEAAGEFLTFVDGDDWIGPDYIRIFLESARTSGADLCVCGFTEATDRHRTFPEKKLQRQTGGMGPLAGHAANAASILQFTQSDMDMSVSALEKNYFLKQVHPGRYEKYTDESSVYRLMSASSRFYRTAFFKGQQICFGTDKTVRGEDMPVGLYTNYFAGTVVVTDQTEYYYYQHDDSARHQMKGLHLYTLPYEQITAVTKKAWEDYRGKQQAPGRSASSASDTSSAPDKFTGSAKDPARAQRHWYFFEFGLIKTMAQMAFVFGRGASKERKTRMYVWQAQIMEHYCADFRDNPYLKAGSGLPIPFWLKTAISCYLLFYQTRIRRIAQEQQHYFE